jgi:hypothetical protein
MMTTGTQPMANPRARVSASRRGEMPLRIQLAAQRFIASRDFRTIALTVS